MEPYNFEEDIKNKLEKRTIKPTTDSWNKLANSLASKSEKKKTKVWYFLAIAASIIGVLFMVSTFLKKDIEQTVPTIVDAPIFQEDTLTSIVIENNTTKLDTLKSTAPFNETVNTVNSVVDTSKETNSKSNKELDKIFVDTKTQTLQNSEKIAVITTINSENDSIYKSVEDEEIELLLSKIEDLKAETTTVSDNEIDALLKNAQLALEFEKLYTENTKTVDAYKLLQDVEADLDKSIRVKFLETLKLNFENMKTLIAQRND